MAVLDSDMRTRVAAALAGLPRPVALDLFAGPEGAAADVMRELVRDITEAAPRVRAVESPDPPPAVSPAGDDDEHPPEGPILCVTAQGEVPPRVRFLGVTSGLEFGSLVNAIRDVSAGDGGLSAETAGALWALPRPVHLQVFTTPSCPYCPQAVRVAHRMAVTTPNVVADMVDTATWFKLGRRSHVLGVPTTVVDGRLRQVGGAPEARILRLVLDAAATPPTT